MLKSAIDYDRDQTSLMMTSVAVNRTCADTVVSVVPIVNTGPSVT